MALKHRIVFFAVRAALFAISGHAAQAPPGHATPLGHSFQRSASVYSERVTMNRADGRLDVGSVQRIIHQGKTGPSALEVDGRTDVAEAVC